MTARASLASAQVPVKNVLQRIALAAGASGMTLHVKRALRKTGPAAVANGVMLPVKSVPRKTALAANASGMMLPVKSALRKTDPAAGRNGMMARGNASPVANSAILRRPVARNAKGNPVNKPPPARELLRMHHVPNARTAPNVSREAKVPSPVTQNATTRSKSPMAPVSEQVFERYPHG